MFLFFLLLLTEISFFLSLPILTSFSSLYRQRIFFCHFAFWRFLSPFRGENVSASPSWTKHVEPVGFWSCIIYKFAEKQTNEFISMKFWCILLYIIIIIIIIMTANQVFKMIWFYHSFWQLRFVSPIVSWLQFYCGGKWY